MTPYLILLACVTVTAYLGRRYTTGGVERLLIASCGLLLVFFAGLRNYTVGTDTGDYISWLSVITSLESAWTFHIEKGFALLVLITSLVSDDYAVLLCVIAFICVGCYLLTIIRFVPRYETALFLFVTLGSYTFFFNGARQGIAAAICFLALRFLLERKALPYVLLIVLATFFHKTAIVALPLYYLATTKINWKTVVYIIAGAVILTLTIKLFAQLAATFLDEKYASYGQEGEGGGLVKTLFLLGQGIVFLLFHRQVGTENVYFARLLNIYLIGLIPAIASVISGVDPSGLLRLTTYFADSAILLWPMIFDSFETRKNRFFVSTNFLIITLLYFLLTTTTFSHLTPYLLNTEIFK